MAKTKRANPSQRFGWKHKPILETLISYFPVGDALDIGCGYLGNSIWLAQRGFTVTAIDFPDIIEEAGTRDDLSAISPPILLMGMDLNNELWTNNQYGVIIAVNVLHFLSPHVARQIIAKIKQDLVENGVVYIRVFSNTDASAKENRFFPTAKEMLGYFREFELLYFKKYIHQDNHPPIGPHEHSLLDLVVKK